MKVIFCPLKIRSIQLLPLSPLNLVPFRTAGRIYLVVLSKLSVFSCAPLAWTGISLHVVICSAIFSSSPSHSLARLKFHCTSHSISLNFAPFSIHSLDKISLHVATRLPYYFFHLPIHLPVQNIWL